MSKTPGMMKTFDGEPGLRIAEIRPCGIQSLSDISQMTGDWTVKLALLGRFDASASAIHMT